MIKLKEILKDNPVLKRNCPKCKGWGHFFIRAGIPNVTKVCPMCKGTGIDPKKKSVKETRIIDPEASLSTGDITLYHGTTWAIAQKAKKGFLGPQPLKEYTVNILVNDFGESTDIAARYYDKHADYRKKDPRILYLTPNFRTARNYAVSNTEWGGEVITDILYRYVSEKYAQGGNAAYASKWIEDHRTKTPAVVTITVPLSMVFTHPHWVNPARKRILNILRNMRTHQKTYGYSKEEVKEIMEDFGEVFVYENIPAKYVQRIDRVE